MNASVSAFLSRHNFVRHIDVNFVAESILDDMNRGLCGKESDEDMIQTWCLPPEKSITNKNVIVIDAGGTNFRSSLVTFDSKGNASISEMEKTKMPGVQKELSKKEFFDEFAKNLEHLKNKADVIGFCFSYPMEITKDGDGILLGFSKEVKAPEVIGCPIGKCLKETLSEHGWKVPSKVTMLNDTVAALLAGKAAAKGYPYSSYIGFILGTGMNAAYIQNETSSLKDFKKQIIVCESGKTKNVILSDFDKAYDKKSQKPGTFFMEKQCAGAYLGSVALEMLKMAADEGLFAKTLTSALKKLESFTTIEMNEFLIAPFDTEHSFAKLVFECGASQEEYDILYELFDSLAERSARCAAAILTAAVIQSGEGKCASKPVCINCDGSTFWLTHKLAFRVHSYLEQVLTLEKGLHWNIVRLEDDITIGTAIAGLVE